MANSIKSYKIYIRPACRNESIHFLGVWLILLRKENVIQQAKDEVFSMCENLKKEKVTDKQLL